LGDNPSGYASHFFGDLLCPCLVGFERKAVKKNPSALWFSAKQQIAAKSKLVHDIGRTLQRRSEIVQRLSDPTLKTCPKSQKQLEELKKI